MIDVAAVCVAITSIITGDDAAKECEVVGRCDRVRSDVC